MKELENNFLEYEMIKEVIRARHEKNLTQQKLTKMMGTRQSNISRFENGEYNPTIHFLSRVAKAVGKKLVVRLV